MPESFDQTSGQPRASARFSTGDSVPRRVLEAILRETDAITASEREAGAITIEALMSIVRRFHGQPFQVETILPELVRASLRDQFQTLWKSEDQLSDVVDSVARALAENPDSLQRTEALWNRLSAATTSP